MKVDIVPHGAPFALKRAELREMREKLDSMEATIRKLLEEVLALRSSLPVLDEVAAPLTKRALNIRTVLTQPIYRGAKVEPMELSDEIIRQLDELLSIGTSMYAHKRDAIPSRSALAIAGFMIQAFADRQGYLAEADIASRCSVSGQTVYASLSELPRTWGAADILIPRYKVNRAGNSENRLYMLMKPLAKT